jgi:hypothetical protein
LHEKLTPHSRCGLSQQQVATRDPVRRDPYDDIREFDIRELDVGELAVEECAVEESDGRSALFALEGVGEHVRVQVSRNRYSVVKSRRASANGKKHFPAGSALAE